MIEHEKKLMLSHAEYTALCVLLDNNLSVTTQTNHYFDTNDYSMNQKGITCRIRESDGKFRTTIKNHGVDHIDSSIESDLEMKELFETCVFDALGLCYQGKMDTKRMVMHEDDYCHIVLDHNTYLGITDYELEIEYRAGFESKALDLLAHLAVYLHTMHVISSDEEFFLRAGKGKNKSERFFEVKKERCDLIACNHR